MSDARQAVRDELSDLVVEGTLIAGLEAAGSAENLSEMLRTAVGKGGKSAGRQKTQSSEDSSRQERRSAMMKRITDQPFGLVYQGWYSCSLSS